VEVRTVLNRNPQTAIGKDRQIAANFMKSITKFMPS
jgi:hypothetical protein